MCAAGVCGGAEFRHDANGNTCNNDNQCESNEQCVYWTNPCVGPPNPCLKSFTNCNVITGNGNKCVAANDTCVQPNNNCVAAATSTCTMPTNTLDVCGTSNKGEPGPIRMCRLGQTVCTKDADCVGSDTCGPATSRMVIAKRAINSVISSSYEMVNFGLMTFYQSGYFPYYKMANGTTTTGTITEFEAQDKLQNAGCFDTAWGPSPTCVISGMSMKLRTLQNSRYLVNDVNLSAEQNFCGSQCLVKGVGTGVYQGSFYEYQGPLGGMATASVVMPDYAGKSRVVGSDSYVYFKALPNYYNGALPPPFDFTDCEQTGVCSAHCGGRWDTALAPFMDTAHDSDRTAAKAVVTAIGNRLEAASAGGLMAFWSTPTGCTLENNSAAASPNNSVYQYMQSVKNGNGAIGAIADPVRCRDNFVLLITDGAANGPGDVDASGNYLCDQAACAATDPEAAGCQCRSVLAAYHLRKNLGVRTYVIGFSGDTAAGSPRIINDNIARAGGTDADGDGVAPFAFLAQREDELVSALQLAVFDAIKGSYSTAPTSTSAGTQQATTVAEGRYALDSRMDFPEWKGHLLAYDLAGTTPVLAWDAATSLAAANWWERRIYTWDGTNMVKFQIDPTTKTLTNKVQLAALGLGATPDEAERVAKWMMGDPTLKNPAIFGSVINSTPIDVASPGDIPLPGGHQYFLANQNRPHLIYVGSSDTQLHAFFLENTTIGTKTFPAGTEAFAFIPPDMLAVAKSQYAQGGQKPDPYSHIFGLADSPKVKTVCVQGCTDANTAVWKTLLLMPEGYGGHNSFMLDVSSPFSSTGVADPPVRMQWHTAYGTSKDAYAQVLGNTISLPAFFLNKTDTLADYRVVFTSGYPATSGSTTQGRALVTAAVKDGTIQSSYNLTPANTCAQEYSALTDVATARDFASGQDNKIIAGYFGDTAGRLWRYTQGNSPTADTDFTCDHPLHFSPTIAQLDRDAQNGAHTHEIYPVQVTNSNLDLDTTARPASKMVFWREIAQADQSTSAITGVIKDTTFGTGGKIELTAGTDICGQATTDAKGVVSCVTPLPATARPASTPLGLLMRDGSGFQVMTMWYMPAPDGCTRGSTYLTIHQLRAGEVTQRLGALVAHEPVTSPVVLRGRIYIFGSSGAVEITNMAPDAVTPGRAVPPSSYSGGMIRFNWTEVLD